MTLHVVASSDADALAVRDHILPIVREHGVLQDFDDKSSPLRLLVLERQVWRFVHWTPFNALTPGQASSPGYLKLTRFGGALQAFIGGFTDAEDTPALFS